MFSGLYEALNQSVSAVLPDASPNASPTRPLGPHSDSPSSPRSSMGRDPISPSLSLPNTLNGGGGEGGAGYSTYQPRRNKPSLEDRLRASLAAKEQKRVVSERESAAGMGAGLRMPSLDEGRVVSSPVTNGPSAGARSMEGRIHGGEEEKPHNIALPSSPPVQNATPFLSQVFNGNGEPPKPNGELYATTVDATKELPQAFAETNDHQAQIVQSPADKLALREMPPQEIDANTAREEPPITTLALASSHPTQMQDPPPHPPILPIQEEAGPLQGQLDNQTRHKDHSQTISLPPPPAPSKYDDPLTPAFLELEREQQAAATKARLPRSPQPKSNQKHTQATQLQSQPGSPQQALHPSSTYFGAAVPPDPLSPPPNPTSHPPSMSISFGTALPPTPSSAALSASPTKQQFAHGRSKSMAPEGEPFIRFGGSSSGMGSASFSLEQVLRKPGVSEGLGLEGVHDKEGLRVWVEGMKLKAATSQDEVTRLHNKLLQQDNRMDELRDTHRLESLSQSELIESLRQKNHDLSVHLASLETSLTAERSLLAAERSTRESLVAAERAKQSTALTDVDTLKEKFHQQGEENARLSAVAKEEEEKRTKAISLLKTVRTKLVKAEKDREDAVKELTALKENAGAGERGREEELRGARNELERVRVELERTRIESGREVERVREESLREFERGRAVLENEMNSLRDAMEREVLARRGEWEIEGIAAKTAHQKEVANLNSRISTLSTSLNQLGDEKSALFSDLQFRTSDLESARTQLEDLQSQLTEANYQLRERDEQLTMAQVELSEARRATYSGSPEGGVSIGGVPSGPEVARLLAAAESRSEARVLELRSRLQTIESERAEQEETWTRSLALRTDEIERLRGMLSAQENESRRVGDYKAAKDREVQELEESVRLVEGERTEFKRRLRVFEGESEALREKIEARDEQVQELEGRVEGLMGSLEELRGKEAQLKLSNKTLREELRKVQSSAALLERQRNPGVGYWGASGPRTPLNGATFSDAMASSPELSRNATAASQGRPGTPGTPASAVNGGRALSTAGSTRSSMEVSGIVQGGDEEVNLEYLRNVILQFLEHEKMRPNLVRVLSVILRFTPQETRRLIAKV